MYHYIICDNCKKKFSVSDADVKTDLVRMMVWCPRCNHKNILELYLCDPEKNKDCSKTGCQGPIKNCFATWKLDCAKIPLTIISSQEMYDKYDKELRERSERNDRSQ